MDVGMDLWLWQYNTAVHGAIPPRAGSRHEVIKLATGGVEDLAAGPVIVSVGIVHVGVLVEDVRVGDHVVEPLGHTDVTLGGIPRRLGGRRRHRP